MPFSYFIGIEIFSLLFPAQHFSCNDFLKIEMFIKDTRQAARVWRTIKYLSLNLSGVRKRAMELTVPPNIIIWNNFIVHGIFILS